MVSPAIFAYAPNHPFPLSIISLVCLSLEDVEKFEQSVKVLKENGAVDSAYQAAIQQQEQEDAAALTIQRTFRKYSDAKKQIRSEQPIKSPDTPPREEPVKEKPFKLTEREKTRAKAK